LSEQRLYRWPPAAKFGRTVPKTKFYQHANVSAVLREKFVAEVQRIIWAYKLADATIHLRGSAAIPEIQVFTIETKGIDVSEAVLTVIDKSVRFPVIFEVADAGRVRMIAAHKTLACAAPRLGPYFTTDWQPIDTPRRPLPTSVDLPTLYEAILTALLPLRARPGESVSDATARMNQSRRLQREIAALERKLRIEPQFNRKFELRRQLTDREAALTELTDPAPSNGG